MMFLHIKNAMLILLLTLSPDLALCAKSVGSDARDSSNEEHMRYTNIYRKPCIEIALRDLKDTHALVEENEGVSPSERKDSGSKQSKPEFPTPSKETPAKDFVPTEKIPADQAVDFPTDI
jgi:hypothetical protein